MGGSVVVGCYHTMLKEGRGGEGRGGEGVNIEDLYHIKIIKIIGILFFPRGTDGDRFIRVLFRKRLFPILQDISLWR